VSRNLPPAELTLRRHLFYHIRSWLVRPVESIRTCGAGSVFVAQARAERVRRSVSRLTTDHASCGCQLLNGGTVDPESVVSRYLKKRQALTPDESINCERRDSQGAGSCGTADEFRQYLVAIGRFYGHTIFCPSNIFAESDATKFEPVCH
jgi:hypothetical protein